MIKLVSTIGFIIVNEKNEILLIKHCKRNNAKETKKDEKITVVKNEDEDEIEAWGIPSGNLEENDNLREVIKREVKRCLNCELKECAYFNLYFYNISDNFIKKASYFYGTIEGEIKTKEKSISTQWINLDKEEIDKLNLIPEQKEALYDFLIFHQNKNNSDKDV